MLAASMSLGGPVTNFFSDLDACGKKIVPPAIALDPVQATPPWVAGAYLFSDNGVGQLAPAMVRPGTRAQWLQGCLGWNGSVVIVPGASTTIQGLGLTLSTTGTVSHPALTATGSTLSGSARHSLIATAAVVNASANVFSAQTLAWRGNASKLGGFYLCSRVLFELTVEFEQVAFCGLYASIASIGNAIPSHLFNMIGVGADALDTNLQLMYNDGSGTATKVDLGSNFSCDARPIVQIELFCAPNASQIAYRVMNLSDTSLSPATGVATSNLPSTSSFLAYHCHVNTGSSIFATATRLRHYRAYLESDV